MEVVNGGDGKSAQAFLWPPSTGSDRHLLGPDRVQAWSDRFVEAHAQRGPLSPRLVPESGESSGVISLFVQENQLNRGGEGWLQAN